MKNNSIDYERYFSTSLFLLIVSLVWFLPFIEILREIFNPLQIPVQNATPGLINSPPPWLQADKSVSRWLELAARSLRLGLATIIFAVPPSLFIAWMLDRCHWPGRQLTRLFWRLLIFMPLPVTATIWLGSFSNLGRSQAFGLSTQPVISGWLAATVVHSIAAMPITAWIFGSVMRRSDIGLEEMARLNSPFPVSIFRSTLRLTIPAILGSAIIALMQTAGDMTVTDLVQERTFAEEAYLQAQMGDGLAAAATTAIPPSVFLALLFFLWFAKFEKKLIKPSAHDSISFNNTGNSLPLNSIWPVMILAGLTFFFWLLPILAIIWRAGRAGGMATLNKLPVWSLKNLFNNLNNARADIAETIAPTLLVCGLTAFFSVILAWLMVELATKNRRLQWLLFFGCVLGLATPGPVAGLAIIWVWIPLRSVYDSPAILIMAQLFRLLPIAVILIWPAVATRSMALTDLLQLDSLSTCEKFRRVILPGMGPLLLTVLFVVFAMAFAELPASNIVAPPGLDLFAVRLWGLMHTGLESHLAAVVLLAMLMIFFTGLILWGFSTWFVKKFEKIRHTMK